MKKITIEKTSEGFQVTMCLKEKTPGGYPILQNYKLENFAQVLGALAEYFEEGK